MPAYVIEREQLIPRPLPEVFDFFCRAENLEVLTPGFLRFRILTPLPIEMRAGAIIEYTLRLWGIPVRWRTLIEAWEPGRRFVDVQLRGPYRSWRHTHAFEAVEGGTRMTDRVEYELPFGFLGALVHALLVGRSVARIFDYRRQRIGELMGGESPRR